MLPKSVGHHKIIYTPAHIPLPRGGPVAPPGVGVGAVGIQRAIAVVERGAGDVGGHWIRCELEATGDFADALAREVLKSGASVVVEQLNRRARFTEPSATDESRERWPMASWWYRFIGSVERGASLMCGEDMSATIERMLEYVRAAAAPAMAAITEARGGDVSWFYELLDDGHRRLKSKHHAAIRVALAEAVAT